MARIPDCPIQMCLFLIAIRVTLANDSHQVNGTEACGGSLSTGKNCLTANETQEARTVLRKCCQSGDSYDTTKRTCVQTNFTSELDTGTFNVAALNDSDFGAVVFGMPNCSYSRALIDFTVTPVSFRDVSPEEFKLELLCVDKDIDNDRLIARRCVKAKDICGKIPCVRKCCPPGRNMRSKVCSKTESDRGFNVTFYDSSDMQDGAPVKIDRHLEFGIYHGSACKIGKYPLAPDKNIHETFYINENGILMMPRSNRLLSSTEYCLEDVHMPKKMDGMYAFVCFQEKYQTPVAKWDVTYTLIAIGLIISCVFLVATFLVYLFLPALQNIHGMTLMCHVASFLVAFLCLATVQIGVVSLSGHACIAIAFVMLFAFLASFAWMNIMCFDIWWTFGGVRSVNHSSRKQQIRKKFAWYSLYAWGVPTAITTAALCLEFIEGLSPKGIKPNMGNNTCWFPNDEVNSKFVFFISPIALLIACNVVLFVLTARNCSKVKSEINRMQKSTDVRSKKKFQADKEKLMMNGKLFVVMGVSWTIEVITMSIPRDHLPTFWTYIPDAFNALQGVAIFAIFVLKAKVLNALADRLGMKKNKDDTESAKNASGAKQIRDPFSQNRKTSASSTCCTTITTVGSCSSGERSSEVRAFT